MNDAKDLPDPPTGIPEPTHRALYAAVGGQRVAEVEERDGHTRIGEPHDYGILNGKPTLLFYQTGGYSRSGGLPQWRHLEVAKVAAVRPLDKTFRGGRAIKTGRHRQWDVLFIRAEP
jgi:hypothetical protein